MKYAYPCIGGPLDGQYATTDDFYRGWGKPEDKYYRPEGMYSHLSQEYCEYNAAYRHSKYTSMIFIHVSLLKNKNSARKR